MVRKKYVLALDQGTTSSRAILFNKNGEIVDSSTKRIYTIFSLSRAGLSIMHRKFGVQFWLLLQEYLSENRCIAKAKLRESELRINGKQLSFGIKKQVDRFTMQLFGNQDKHADICEELKEKGYNDLFRKKTGLLIDAYFSGTKVKWILDHVEGAQRKAQTKGNYYSERLIHG